MLHAHQLAPSPRWGEGVGPSVWLVCVLKSALGSNRPERLPVVDVVRRRRQKDVMTIRPSIFPLFMSLNTWLMSSSFIS
jgi:hypothetical protein